MKNKKTIFIVVFFSLIILCLIGYSIWTIIYNIGNILPVYDGLPEKGLLNFENVYTYNGSIQYPTLDNAASYESLNGYEFSYEYYDTSRKKWYDCTDSSGPIDAGDYYLKIIASKTESDGSVDTRYSQVKVKINKANPIITAPTGLESVLFSPEIYKSLSSSGFIVTGVLGETISNGDFDFISQDSSNIDEAGVGKDNAKDSHLLTVNYNYKSNNSNYNDLNNQSFNVPLLSVCHIGSSSSPNYYSRIENALSSATSGNKIYVLLKGTNIATINKPVIYDNCTIPEGVSLIAPYSVSGITVNVITNHESGASSAKTLSGTDGYLYNWVAESDDYESKNMTNASEGFADRTKDTESANLKTLITLAENVELKIEGELLLSGVLGSAIYSGIQGHTSGAYTQVNMRPGSSIICESGGSIINRGYIKEVDSNDQYVNVYNNHVTIKDGGTIKMPFIIYDYYGGGSVIGTFKGSGALTSANSRESNVIPFNILDMPNVQTTLIMQYGSEMYGYCDLYTNGITVVITIEPRHNPTESKIIGKSDALINMEAGSQLTFETKLNTPGYTSHVVKSKVTNLLIEGNIKFGEVSLSITVAIYTATVSTGEVYFPISYLFNITIHTGNTQINKKIKLLPGAVVTVDKSATLSIGNGSTENGELIIYSKYENTNNTYTKPGPLQYPTNLEEAKLTIYRGSLNVKANSSLGGKIIAGSDEASINIDSNAILNVTSREGYGDSSGTNVNYYETFSLTERANGYLYNASSASINTTTSNFNAGVYESIEANQKNGWLKSYGNIIYNGNGGNVETSSETVKLPYTIIGDDLQKPTREHYTFDAWYTSANCLPNEKVEELMIYETITLYAGWIPVEYPINIEYKYNLFDDGFTDSNVDNITNEPDTYNILTNGTLGEPVHPNGYTFDNWYFDEECTILVGNLVGAEYVPNTITIYGLWYPEDVDSFNVEFSFAGTNTDTDSKGNKLLPDSKKVVSTVSAFIESLNTFNSYNIDPSYPKYFAGWFTTEDFQEGTELTEDYVFNQDENVTNYIYGKWADKAKVQVNYYHASSATTFDNISGSLFLKPGTYSIDSLKSSDNTTISNLFSYSDEMTVSEIDYKFYRFTSGTAYNGTTITSLSLSSGVTTTIYGQYLKYVNVKFTFTMDLEYSYNGTWIKHKYKLDNDYVFNFDGQEYTIFTENSESGENVIEVKTLEYTSYQFNSATKTGVSDRWGTSTKTLDVTISSTNGLNGVIGSEDISINITLE